MVDYEAGDWPVLYDLAACSIFTQPEGDPDLELAALQEASEHVAINLLWNFTNRFFGTRTVELRPVRQPRSVRRPSTFEGRGPIVNYPMGQALGWLPVMIEGQWYNLRCGSCGSACSCSAPWSIELPGPVTSVVEVMIDGNVVPETEYWLDGSKLIRKEGDWPTAQNMRLPVDEVGTWSITYNRGTAVPLGGQYSAGILACELGKAALNDNTCVLPSRVQTITRQGVTIAIIDELADLMKGRLGVPQVDTWIQSVLVARSAARLPVSPDVPGSSQHIRPASTPAWLDGGGF